MCSARISLGTSCGFSPFWISEYFYIWVITRWILVKRLTLFVDRVFDIVEDFRLQFAATVLVGAMGWLRREDWGGTLARQARAGRAPGIFCDPCPTGGLLPLICWATLYGFAP